MPHSIPVDGGNASLSCLPTTKKKDTRRRRRVGRAFEMQQLEERLYSFVCLLHVLEV